MTFLNFFEESSYVFLPDGKPPYNYGDHIIMDNAPIHRDRAGEALGEWLHDISCTLLYLPTYSPEFNPAELVFNKLKTILKRFEFRELLRDNLHIAVHEALTTITHEDMSGFFKPGFHMIVRIVPIVPVVSKNFDTIGTTETIAGFHMIVSIASNTEYTRSSAMLPGPTIEFWRDIRKGNGGHQSQRESPGLLSSYSFDFAP